MTWLISLIPTILGLVQRIIPDKQSQKDASAELLRMIVEGDLRDVEARANVVMSELNSQNFLAASWRPIMMFIFMGLVVGAWFGFVPPKMPPEMIDRVFSLLEIGMGGYVVGRSAEKIAETASQVFRK